MSTPTPTEAAPKKATPFTRALPKNVILAIAIKPSPDPEQQSDGTLKYKMCFVSLAGKKTFVPCSKSIWFQVTQHRYPYDHQSNFKLRYDQELNMVTAIDRVVKPEEAPEFFSVEGAEANGKVLLLIGGDGAVSVKNTPSGVSPGIIEDIVKLATATPDIDADELLGDRFLVESSMKKGGQRTLVVDPTQR